MYLQADFDKMAYSEDESDDGKKIPMPVCTYRN